MIVNYLGRPFEHKLFQKKKKKKKSGLWLCGGIKKGGLLKLSSFILLFFLQHRSDELVDEGFMERGGVGYALHRYMPPPLASAHNAREDDEDI
jgi:hypothetical protein